MDIANINTQDHTYEVLHPVTDEPVGIRVTIMSQDDARMKPIKRKITDFNLQKQKRGKTLKAVEIEASEVELLAATITGWDWYGDDVTYKGEKPEFSLKNVKDVLSDPKIPWFRKQLNEQLDDEKGFFST